MSTPLQQAEHARRVKDVSEQLARRPPGKRISVRKATSSHSTHDLSFKNSCYRVDVSALTSILEIDEKNGFVWAEGQVDMGQLCKATLARGLLPLCVPEYDSFTVSGLVAGLGIQTSAHIYGLFNNALHAIEVVADDGKVYVCDNKKQYPDLFGAMSGSYGTMGVITAAKIKLRPAKPYVHSRYFHYTDLDEYVAAFNAQLEKPDFHDGVVYAKDHYTLVLSNFCDEKDLERLPPVTYDPMDPHKQGEEYYYQYVRHSRKRGIKEDVINTLSFLFRSMRGSWWVMEAYVGDGAKFVVESPWGRRRLDKKADEVFASNGFADPLLSVEERERCLVFQDMGIALSRLKEGIQYVQRELNVYPLWTCAVKNPDTKSLFHGKDAAHREKFVVDIGIYGEPMVKNYQNRRQMRALQTFVDAPAFWGVVYLSKDEMRELYDIREYENLRRKYSLEGFTHIEDKVCFMDASVKDKGPIWQWRLVRVWRENKLLWLFLVLLTAFIYAVMFGSVLFAGRTVYNLLR